jgi:hypothetical protein
VPEYFSFSDSRRRKNRCTFFQGEKSMKRKAVLSALLALAVAAPAVVAPSVAPSLAPIANAQNAEYPDVPLDHWAYNAINKLSAAGIIEGYPNGTYSGGRAMTR